MLVAEIAHFLVKGAALSRQRRDIRVHNEQL